MVAKVEGFVDYLVNDRTASDNLSGAVGFAKSEAAAANNYIQTHSADQIATDAGNFDFDRALLTVATAGAGEVIGGLVKAGGLALDLAEDAVASVGERAAVSDSKSALAAPEAGSIEAGSEATVASGEGAVATRAVQTELTQAVSATEPVLGSAAEPIAGAANSAGEIAAASSPLQEAEEVAALKVGNWGPIDPAGGRLGENPLLEGPEAPPPLVGLGAPTLDPLASFRSANPISARVLDFYQAAYNLGMAKVDAYATEGAFQGVSPGLLQAVKGQQVDSFARGVLRQALLPDGELADLGDSVTVNRRLYDPALI